MPASNAEETAVQLSRFPFSVTKAVGVYYLKAMPTWGRSVLSPQRGEARSIRTPRGLTTSQRLPRSVYSAPTP